MDYLGEDKGDFPEAVNFWPRRFFNHLQPFVFDIIVLLTNQNILSKVWEGSLWKELYTFVRRTLGSWMMMFGLE